VRSEGLDRGVDRRRRGAVVQQDQREVIAPERDPVAVVDHAHERDVVEACRLPGEPRAQVGGGQRLHVEPGREVGGDPRQHGAAVERPLVDARERLVVVTSGQQAVLRRGARAQRGEQEEQAMHQRSFGA
jgi:hypothetical protein